MQKNVASQKIGAQLVSATDGSAFTGSVTVSVTGDAGMQATGSVGAGACTHEGNGYHTYAPAQAETNYDLIAFTFTGTGAVPVTVQVYTRFDANTIQIGGDTQSAADLKDFADAGYDPSTNKVQGVVLVDTTTTTTTATNVTTVSAGGIAAASFATGAITATVIATDAIDADAIAANAVTEIQSGLATASSLASLDTKVDTIDGIVDAILVDTAEIGTAGAGLTVLATAANLAMVAGYLDTEIAAILADTNELQTDWANGGRLDLILDARASQTSVDTIDDLLDTEIPALTTAVADLPTNAELATALGTADDAVLAAIAALNNLSASAVFTTQLTESYAADGTAPTLAQALFLIQQALTEFTISGTTTTIKRLDGSTTAATLTLNDGTTPTGVTRAS